MKKEKKVLEEKGEKSRQNRRFTESFKQALVREIEAKNIQTRKASKIYGVPYATLFGWVKKYGSGLDKSFPPTVLADKNNKDTELLNEENKLLRKALEASNQKVFSLETMIDIAEKELSIDIRKKSGTKQ